MPDRAPLGGGTASPPGGGRARPGPTWRVRATGLWFARATGPWWVRVLLVTLTARLVSGLAIVLVARTQAENLWLPASPGYLEDTGVMWDASWYREIAEHGYPSELPVGPDGRVVQNPWAFFPLYPMLARSLMDLLHAPWVVVAPVLSLLLGTLAMLVVHAVVADAVAGSSLPERVRRHAPLATVALLATSASSPVLQVAYTEALALLLVASALWALQRERYLVAAVATVALGVTRAVALPLALVVLVHGFARARSGGPFPARDKVAVGVLAAVAGASGLVWPVVVAWVTGRPDAYAVTQGAWRGRGEVLLLVPWLDVSRWLVGSWAPLLLGVVAALVVIGLAAWPWRELGVELHSWVIGYTGYLVLVLEPGTSLVRFAILAFPAWAALAVAALGSRRPRLWLALGVLGGLVGQAAWLGLLWRLVPPAGWPP